MPRKVFISVLGTGFYGSCKYVKGDFVSSETRFIQEAALEFYDARQWAATDTALFLLTARAEEINWRKEIKERSDRNGQQPYTGLEQILIEMKLPFTPMPLSIPDGKDEKEMWAIFDILFNSLREGDELYFDLTHSFRYLPMLVLVLGNYAKFLKGVEVVC